MYVRVIHIDKVTRKWCKVYLYSKWEVIETFVRTLNPRTTPHCQKIYIVKNKKSPSGTLLLYWYEVEVWDKEPKN